MPKNKGKHKFPIHIQYCERSEVEAQKSPPRAREFLLRSYGKKNNALKSLIMIIRKISTAQKSFILTRIHF